MNRLNSIASAKPRRVIAKAANFRWCGMVMWGTVVGVRLDEIMNPAKMLPRMRRLMALMRKGLFSLIWISIGYRGCPSRTKKTIRVL